MPLTRLSLWSHGIKARLNLIFLQDRLLLLLFLFALVLNCVLYLVLYLLVKPSADPLVLHYSVYFGIDLIGSWYSLYLTPAVGTFLWLVNVVLALVFYQEQRLAAYLLGGVTALMTALLLLGGSLLVWINL
ncbi:hypothetical protein HY933_04170 [Candidatus Falkowbacteria bacterium]|nr:hypothetical protein [Candidatus Falkowbacteria bacterium]